MAENPNRSQQKIFPELTSNPRKRKHFWGVFKCGQCAYVGGFAEDLKDHVEQEGERHHLIHSVCFRRATVKWDTSWPQKNSEKRLVLVP